MCTPHDFARSPVLGAQMVTISTERRVQGIRTKDIYRLYLARQPIDTIANHYQLTYDEVLAAVMFETEREKGTELPLPFVVADSKR